MLRTRRAD